MEIQHRIAFNGDTKPKFKLNIDKLGIKYEVSPLPGHTIGLVYFDIFESDPNWMQVQTLVQEIGASDVYDTIFTEEEILGAPWSRLIPVFEQGYPQPESSWSVNPITYEGHCPECGVYEKQGDNFRIKKEPRLGKNQFMTLHWGYALFTTSTVLAELANQQVQGYEVWDVLIHKTGRASKTISQIYIPHVAKAAFIPEEGLRRKECPRCGTTKYFPHMRGYMHFGPKLLETNLDFMLSREWFGDGHAAFREILVSNKVARLILENKWQGVKLKPVQIVP